MASAGGGCERSRIFAKTYRLQRLRLGRAIPTELERTASAAIAAIVRNAMCERDELLVRRQVPERRLRSIVPVEGSCWAYRSDVRVLRPVRRARRADTQEASTTRGPSRGHHRRSRSGAAVPWPVPQVAQRCSRDTASGAGRWRRARGHQLMCSAPRSTTLSRGSLALCLHGRSGPVHTPRHHLPRDAVYTGRCFERDAFASDVERRFAGNEQTTAEVVGLILVIVVPDAESALVECRRRFM